jgi:hypothetical protein
MWYIIVISTTLATIDLYPGGNSREKCERIERAMAAAAQPDVRMECVPSSQVEPWEKFR